MLYCHLEEPGFKSLDWQGSGMATVSYLGNYVNSTLPMSFRRDVYK